MDYAAARAWLTELQRLGVRPGTERVAEVLHRLGDPQRRYAAVHIAGTNGKGSTAAMTAALLLTVRAVSGRRGPIGLYTSPHLLRLTERVQLGAGPLRECTGDELGAALGVVRAAAERAPAQELTFFEALTAAAFWIFAEAGVEVAVVETGLGGRLDATRLCQPAVTVVTSIGWDHMELLGDTLERIAWEKAGIFRAGVPALVACDDRAALAVLREEAVQVGAPLGVYGERGGVAALDDWVVLPLQGQHQRRNAALALAAVCCVAERDAAQRRALADVTQVQAGFLAARWPGRLERLRQETAGPEVWVDAAHNPEGAAALSEWLAGLGRRVVVVLGVVEGKQVEGMLGPLRWAERVVLTRPPSPRGREPQELVGVIDRAARSAAVMDRAARSAAVMDRAARSAAVMDRAARSAAVMDRAARSAAVTVGAPPLVCPDVAEALARAVELAGPGGMVLGYGSIFLVAELRRLVLGEPADEKLLQDPVRGGAPASR